MTLPNLLTIMLGEWEDATMTKQEMQAKIDKLDAARLEVIADFRQYRDAAAREGQALDDYRAMERAFPDRPFVAAHDRRTLLTRVKDEIRERENLLLLATTSLAETKAVLRTLAVEHWGEEDAAVKLQYAVHGVPPTIDGDA